MAVVLSDGLMFAKSKVILYGRYKSMKSMLALRFMLSCATGKPWLGFRTPPEGLRALYLQLEIPELLLQDRIQTMLGESTDEIKEEPILWSEAFLKMDTPDGFRKVEKELERHKPSVLIVDPLYKLLTGNISDPHHIGMFLDNMDRLIAKYEISLMILSHGRKQLPVQGSNEIQALGSDDLLGSVLLSAWPDSIMRVAKKEDEIRVDFDIVRHARRQLQPAKFTVTPDINFKRKVDL